MKSKIINLSLRVGGMGIRLFFLMFLSKETTEFILGEYSLIATTISVGLIIIGFDLYVNGTREIIANKIDRHPQIIFNQAIANLPIYILFLPLLLIVFFNNTISWDYLLLFYLLLISEHIGSELFRLFVAIEKPILANFLFLIRNASWGAMMIILGYLKIVELSVSNILIAWIIASFSSLAYALFKLFNFYKFKNVSIDISMMKSTYSVAVKFFIGTLAYKIVEFSDRYFLDSLLGKEIVGIYSFFGQISSVLNTIVYTIVITLLYPVLLKSIYNQDRTLFYKTKNKMLFEIVFISILAFIGGLIFLDPLMQIIGKDTFFEYKFLFYLFLLSNTVFNISYVYHFVITGYKHDTFLMLVTLAGGLIDLVLNFILIPKHGILGAISAKIVAFTFILVLKFTFFKINKLSPN